MGTLIFKKNYNLNLDVLNKCIKGGIINSRLGLMIKNLSKSIDADGMNTNQLDQHDLFFIPKNVPERILWENLRESAKIQIKGIERSRTNGKLGGRPKKEPVQAIPEPKKETIVRGSFIPPTLEEVLEYGKQMNEMIGVGGFMCSRITATDFYNHYESQGWLIGNGIHMTNWKSKLRKWANDEEKRVMES